MISCDEALELNPLEAEIETTIDIDDSGPLEPFDATCVFQRMILLLPIICTELKQKRVLQIDL